MPIDEIEFDSMKEALSMLGKKTAALVKIQKEGNCANPDKPDYSKGCELLNTTTSGGRRKRKSRKKKTNKKRRKTRNKKGGGLCGDVTDCRSCITLVKPNGKRCSWNKNSEYKFPNKRCRQKSVMRKKSNGWIQPDGRCDLTDRYDGPAYRTVKNGKKHGDGKRITKKQNKKNSKKQQKSKKLYNPTPSAPLNSTKVYWDTGDTVVSSRPPSQKPQEKWQQKGKAKAVSLYGWLDYDGDGKVRPPLGARQKTQDVPEYSPPITPAHDYGSTIDGTVPGRLTQFVPTIVLGKSEEKRKRKKRENVDISSMTDDQISAMEEGQPLKKSKSCTENDEGCVISGGRKTRRKRRKKTRKKRRRRR